MWWQRGPRESALVCTREAGSAHRSTTCCSHACSYGCEAAVTFAYMPMGASFTERALALARALLPAEAQEAAWREQVSRWA